MRRLAAVLLGIALVGADATLCAGWSLSPQARMACCTEDGTCPMEQAASRHQSGSDVDDQANADRCCAVSENTDTAASPSVFVLTSSVLLPVSPVAAIVPATDCHLALRRSVVPAPLAAVPKHLLLSVLLV